MKNTDVTAFNLWQEEEEEGREEEGQINAGGVMNILLPSLIHSINSINYVRQLSRSEEQAGSRHGGDIDCG